MFSSIDEVRFLSDSLFDGTIGAEEMRRLDELIMSDRACLQAYLETINIHSSLLKKANPKNDKQAIHSMLKNFSMASGRRKMRSSSWISWKPGTSRQSFAIVFIASLIICGVITWSFSFEDSQSIPAGNISYLTSDARLQSGKDELGTVVWEGSIISIAEGMVGLQLADKTMVDLLGPAELMLTSSKQVRLLKGSLVVRIQKGGEGFTVLTPDTEVVDLGTEFLVQYDPETGTDVLVLRGRVNASLLDKRGKPTKRLELTDNRSANFRQSSQSALETALQFSELPILRSRCGGILSTSGTIRTLTSPSPQLVSRQTYTRNHMLVIPERQNITLQNDLLVTGYHGSVHFGSGSIISSYLVHYDPTEDVNLAPRGAITFTGQIAGVITESGELLATDSIFGLPGAKYDSAEFRGLELGEDEDKLHISTDRRTISFRFDITAHECLDQARVLVVDE